jgi:hypothetical protein
VARLAPVWRALRITGMRESFAAEVETLLAERDEAEPPPVAETRSDA